MYLHGTATVPLGTPALVRCIAPASVPPTGTFLNWNGIDFTFADLIYAFRT